MHALLPGGFLVAIEGIDGAGKSTLIPVLMDFCARDGLACVASREPTQGPWGRRLRESATRGRLPLESEIEFFCRDRAEHVANVISPALRAGKVILLDRYYFSSAAYQGARGANPDEIIRANETFAPPPDLVLLLDLDPGTGLGRVRARGDRPDEFEREQELLEVRRIFQSLQFPGIVRLDAAQPREVLHRDAIGAFAEALRKKRAS